MRAFKRLKPLIPAPDLLHGRTSIRSSPSEFLRTVIVTNPRSPDDHSPRNMHDTPDAPSPR